MLAFIVATLAPILNSIQYLPQVYKAYTTKSVADLSIYSLLLVIITSVLWTIHGYFTIDNSLIVAAVISVIINTVMLILYFVYRKNRRLK